MELKVWVEGIQRIVCGVTEVTTCQDVVFALAHATGKTGRFTLIERWRNNERLLAPHENPLKILMKWGEYSSDVQFILQRSEQKKPDQSQQNNNNNNISSNTPAQNQHNTPQQQPQQQQPHPQSQQQILRQQQKLNQLNNNHLIGGSGLDDPKSKLVQNNLKNSAGSTGNDPYGKQFNQQQQQQHHHHPQQSELISNCLPPSSLERGKETRKSLNSGSPPNLKTSSNNNNIIKSFSNSNIHHNNNNNNNNAISPSNIKIENIGIVKGIPQQKSPHNSTSSSGSNSNANELLLLNELSLNDGPLQNTTQYRDLIQLIKYQREKINTQQADLSKYDSEIQYLESKGREQQDKLDALTQEISKTDQVYRQGSEQLQTLQYVEEEGELVRQQEKTLKSEITLLRSKLANCETELLQCKNKIRLLMDEIQVEQRKYCRQIQLEIDLAIQSTDHASKATDKLKSEVAGIESNIAEKKKQVEQLVHEMKEVNLQSLAVAPADEVRHLLEVGSVKPGSTRRMIGSPRQLENAVPTSKNPHGVWV